MPSGFRKSSFRIERLQEITKTKGADQCKQISKKGVNIQPKSMKNRPRNSTKNDALKYSPTKPQKTQTMTPKSVPENGRIFGMAPLGAPLLAQTAFGH